MLDMSENSFSRQVELSSQVAPLSIRIEAKLEQYGIQTKKGIFITTDGFCRAEVVMLVIDRLEAQIARLVEDLQIAKMRSRK